MTSKKRPPFTISRTNTYRSTAGFTDKSLTGSFEDLNAPIFQKQSSFFSKQNSLNLHDTAFKSHYNIFKTDTSMMPDLLEKYSQENLQYRDEEFTQQAETFITKIAADKRIPKDLRAKFPLYQILISICKIFMLNEYEIVVFACSLDHCNWKIDDIVLPEESDYLKEFPSNFGVEISDECKRFIMYLLIITFSLKQYLNEKTNVDKIQAYCEKICVNFQTLFNRWNKISSFHKFNYSAPEINRKFKHLSKRESGDHFNSVKDYNMIVDNIMTLTGSYSSKPKIDCKPIGTSLGGPIIGGLAPIPNNNNNNIITQKTEVFHDLSSSPAVEPKPLYPESFHASSIERSLSRQKGTDFLTELSGLKIPSVNNSYSRQQSISNFLNLPFARQGSFDIFDELHRALLKQEAAMNAASAGGNGPNNNNNVGVIQPIPRKTADVKLTDLLRSENEDLINIAVPMLSKKSSTISQQGPTEELTMLNNLPSFSRFNSGFPSFLNEK